MRKFNFPGGECHLDVGSEFDSYAAPRFDLWSADDIMQMLLYMDVVKHANADEGLNGALHISIPYVPYARQDRRTSNFEPLSIKVMADLINNIKADSVTIWDPHSDVTSALIDNVIVFNQWELVPRVVKHLETYDGIIAPDIGAMKKAYKVAEVAGKPLYQVVKVRDTYTGKIEGIKLVDKIPEEAQKLLVIDDICDGGRTFTGTADAVRAEAPPVTLDLYVTHGIFSNGLSRLLERYNHIYCANPKDKNLEMDRYTKAEI